MVKTLSMVFERQLTYLYITLLFILTACGHERVTVKQDIFFSLEKFIGDEKEKLSGYDSIQKFVRLNGNIDSTLLELEQAKRELEIFSNADINKASWLDKYRVDSLIDSAGRLRALEYTSLDSSLNTRLLRVTYSQDSVESIWLKRKKKTLISSKQETMEYLPGRGYRINNLQTLILADDQRLEVEVAFD